MSFRRIRRMVAVFVERVLRSRTRLEGLANFYRNLHPHQTYFEHPDRTYVNFDRDRAGSESVRQLETLLRDRFEHEKQEPATAQLQASATQGIILLFFFSHPPILSSVVSIFFSNA